MSVQTFHPKAVEPVADIERDLHSLFSAEIDRLEAQQLEFNALKETLARTGFVVRPSTPYHSNPIQRSAIPMPQIRLQRECNQSNCHLEILLHDVDILTVGCEFNPIQSNKSTNQLSLISSLSAPSSPATVEGA